MRNLFLIALAALLSACAATGKPFVKLDTPGEQEARLYVYRPDRFVQSGIYPTVSLDSKPVGNLMNGGYLTFLVPNGSHTLTLSGGFIQWGYRERSYPISVEGGHTYYYKLDLNMRGDGNGFVHIYNFDPVEESKASVQLQSLRESQ